MGGWTRLAEADSGWDLDQSPGFLRLQVRVDAWQVLVRDAPQGSFEISTRVLFLPYSNFQTAGMVVYKDEGCNLSFHRGTCESIFEVPDLSQSNAVYFIHTDRELAEEDRGYAVGPQFPTRTDVVGEAYLRLTREGSMYTGYFSEDGE
jgi:hypothetical protein